MKYKKFISSKSRFWVGTCACAVVGLIATVVSYFSSTQHIDNMYKPIFYQVSAYDIFDKTEVSSLNMDKATKVNTDIVVNDDSTTPVLVRIRYCWGYMEQAYDENGNDVYRMHYETCWDWDTGEELKDKNGNLVYWGQNICAEYEEGADYTCGIAKNYGTEDAPNYPFLYNEYDGAYYYNKILYPGEKVQHLDAINFRSEGYDADEESGLTEFANWYSWSTSEFRDDEGQRFGRGISFGTGTSVSDGIEDKNFSNISGLKIIAEAVEAIDTDGKPLTLTGEETADEMESYWNNLGLRLPNWDGPNEEEE
ncbi:MAG: hypothetical protein ACI4PR_03625 [Acutalibacteraceae bacterium]